MTIDLPFIWAALIAFAVIAYVVLDGFDLGVGIVFPFLKKEEERDQAMNSVAPVWDGNETWLVLGGGGLLAVFPLAYAVIMPALYMPVILMLLALIFRGVSFEMRFKAETAKGQIWWDRAFCWGSYVATLCQGIALGALVQGIRVEGHTYAGGWWDWLTPFSLFTGAALVVGYGLLGACWLVLKTEGSLQQRVRVSARRLGVATVLCIAIVSLAMLVLEPAFRERWLTFPNLLFAAPVPIFVIVLTWRLLASLTESERRWLAGETAEDRQVLWHDGLPFICSLGMFLLSYVGL